MNFKLLSLFSATSAFLLGKTLICAQVVPATPQGFQTRKIGEAASGASTGATVAPKKPMARYTTRLILSESRTWTNADGKTISGQLIAFEDMVVVAEKGASQPPAPEPPEHPTVVRDGKVRILSNQKPYEIPLSKLSAADQKFARTVQKAHAPKPDEP